MIESGTRTQQSKQPAKQIVRQNRIAWRNLRGEIAVVLIGGSLAVSSAVFAAWMLYQGPYQPGAGDFNLIELVRNTGANAEADEIVTGSIGAPSAITAEKDIPQWFNVAGRAIDYRLKAVVADKAFVEISSGPDNFTWAVNRGGTMPGLGKVSEISVKDGKWVLRAQKVQISERGAELSAQ